MFRSLLSSLLLLALTTACASAPSSAPRSSLPAVEVEYLEERTLLLLLSDRRVWEPFTVERCLEGGPSLRRELALTLGRLKDPQALPALAELLADDSAEVRRAAAFALGEIAEENNPRAGEMLVRVLADPDRTTGRLAVEGLAKAGASLTDVVERLLAAPSAELLPRLLPALFRFRDPAAVRWAEQGLQLPDPELHALAAYTLGRDARPEGLALLRTLFADPDPWVRGWGARGLGQVGEREDFDRLRALLDDAEPGPIIQALRAARRMTVDGRAAAPASWKPRLLELLADPRPGVRLTAIETATSWLLDDDLGATLEHIAKTGLRRERELALLALAEAEDPRAWSLTLELARAVDPVLRASAARAAGFLAGTELLERLAGDPEPMVRAAALEVRLAQAGEQGLGIARTALADSDPALRSAALEWAVEHPQIAMESLEAAMAERWRDRIPDARLSGVRALAARAKAQELEHEAIAAALERLVQDGDFLVRRAAIRALGDLGEEKPALGPATTARTVEVYREIVQRTAQPRAVVVETERGNVRLRLACPEAPLTCLSFLQLAAQGFYDGLTFHRVVPDFVVQTGDPRGDGSGGPGYSIRDEVNLLRYHRGVVGMALSGPDTGGSQFFITLSAQPHLDGGYTAFGTVEAGWEVLDQIVQGDRIVRIAEVPVEPSSPGAATAGRR